MRVRWASVGSGQRGWKNAEMGVICLWQALAPALSSLEATACLDAVDGRVIAVDLSIWIMDALQQPALERFSQEGRCLKVVFERVRELRMGIRSPGPAAVT